MGAFEKLLDRSIPGIIIRLLIFWYTKQTFTIRWGNSTSEAFNASNGVRQGGVISPHFFNVYVDDLIGILNKSGIGCNINGTSYNNLMYADDTVILSPSAKGLQHLLQLCEIYATKSGIVFNSKKTVYMCINPKGFNPTKVPDIVLNGENIKLCDEHKYLGVQMCNSNTDDNEMSKQLRKLYARGNMLARNFSNCSNDVKVQLFSTYCSTIFGCQLWSNYRQESLRRLKVAYNRIFKLLMKINGAVSMSALLLSYNVSHFNVLLRKLIIGFMKRIAESDNILISTIYKSNFYLSSKMFLRWCKFVF